MGFFVSSATDASPGVIFDGPSKWELGIAVIDGTFDKPRLMTFGVAFPPLSGFDDMVRIPVPVFVREVRRTDELEFEVRGILAEGDQEPFFAVYDMSSGRRKGYFVTNPTNPMQNPTNIILTKQVIGFRAQVEGRPGISGDGGTQQEALGDLVSGHRNIFKVDIALDKKDFRTAQWLGSTPPPASPNRPVVEPDARD